MADNCCICYEILAETNKVTLNCGHSFHFSCILKIERAEEIRKCPLCRESYSKDIPPSFSELFAKVVILRSHVSECSGHKKIRAVIDLLNAVLLVAETYGDNSNSLISSIELKIPELKKEILELGYYPADSFDSLEKRIKSIKKLE